MNCRLTHLYDMYWSSESRCTWMPHSLGHATGTYWHSPSTAPPCRCSSCLPSSPIHLQPSALLLQRTMRANTCFLKNKSSVVWSGDFLQKGQGFPSCFKRLATTRERCFPQQKLVCCGSLRISNVTGQRYSSGGFSRKSYVKDASKSYVKKMPCEMPSSNRSLRL